MTPDPRRWFQPPVLDDAMRLQRVVRADGSLALRVDATGVGLLRCQGSTRLMWGSLSTIFLLQAHTRQVQVDAWTLRGRMRWLVALEPGFTLQRPPVPVLEERPRAHAMTMRGFQVELPAAAVAVAVEVAVPHVRIPNRKEHSHDPTSPS